MGWAQLSRYVGSNLRVLLLEEGVAIIAVKLRRATSFVSFLLPVSPLFAGKLEEKNSLSKQASNVGGRDSAG